MPSSSEPAEGQAEFVDSGIVAALGVDGEGQIYVFARLALIHNVLYQEKEKPNHQPQRRRNWIIIVSLNI